MALTGFGSRSCCLSIAASVIVSILVILGSSSQIQGIPLVYPNRFSFQKTSTTSTTQVPLHDHDHSNKSISSFGKAGTESVHPSSYGRSFHAAVWVIGVGALLLLCLLVAVLYPRTKRRNDLSSSSCYAFPVNSNLKADLDSSSIITITNSEVP